MFVRELWAEYIMNLGVSVGAVAPEDGLLL